MARILAISSEVVRGHVGNTAARVALQALGHEVWALPTIVLSNHPGHGHTSGTRLDPAALLAMVEALGRNGWLGEVDAVLTGYLPSAEHVEVARYAVEQVRAKRADARVLVDPILGDHPKGLYLDAHAAQAIRNRLLPLADVATPNAFELGWLSGLPISDGEQAAHAAAHLGVPRVLATSVPVGPDRLLNMLVAPREPAEAVAVARRARVPNGTGDLLAALFLGHWLAGEAVATALGRAVAGVEAAIAASAGADELRLIGSRTAWAHPEPLPVAAP